VQENQTTSLSVTCQCGKVMLEVTGAPILATACYCNSCQRAGREFEKLPSAPKVLDADGGTPVLLYRKDRVRCVKGQEYLQARRLKPNSPSRRILATCCNSALCGDFTKGHWLSLYRNRFSARMPPIQMRIMTKERAAGVQLPNDVPNYEGFSGKFALKLIGSWIAMGFKKPDMGLGQLPEATFSGEPAGP
jgi:hypothetical protein